MQSMFGASAARCKCFQIALSTADFNHKLIVTIDSQMHENE